MSEAKSERKLKSAAELGLTTKPAGESRGAKKAREAQEAYARATGQPVKERQS